MPQQRSNRPPPANGPRQNAADDGPIDADTFARLIGRLGPFERPPHLAVAVSGGADSLCLTLLLAEWVEALGGTLQAFHVDHRLRPESSREALMVAGMLQRAGIGCEILVWDEHRQGAGLQERARAARYLLLEAACRRQGFLHLALGHQANDQDETIRMRAGRGQHFVGLSGMGDLRETRNVRIIRPLLSIPKVRIEATLRQRNMGWLEDPSNRSSRFERNRIRRLSGPAPLSEEREEQPAAIERQGLENEAARLLARHARLRPEGWVILDWPAFEAAGPLTGRYALGAVLRTIAGKLYLPARTALDQLTGVLSQGGCGSLHGCVARARGEKVIIWREWARISASPLRLEAGSAQLWDGRFLVSLDEGQAPCSVQPLGAIGPLEATKFLRLAARRRGIPASVANALPVVIHENALPGTPTLVCAVDGRRVDGVACLWRPLVPLTSGPHHSPLL